MLITPGTKIGPYTVEAEIGRGGMGVVYRASDTRLDRSVAIKALPAELAGNPDRLARFEREARLLAQLNHPNVSGRLEVYLRPLVPQNPESAPIHPVTNEGGEDPRWSADGMTVYYRNPTDRSIYAVSVRTEPQIEISRPRLLTDMEGEEWDVTPDERVVMVKNAEGAEGARPDVRIILNWD